MKPCRTWGCAHCIDELRSIWVDRINENLSEAPEIGYIGIVPRPDMRNRVAPQMRRAARKSGEKLQFYVVSLSEDEILVYSTIYFTDSSQATRSDSIDQLTDAVNKTRKFASHSPVSTSRGWGMATRPPAETEYEFIGTGAQKSEIETVLARHIPEQLQTPDPKGFAQIRGVVANLAHLSAELVTDILAALRRACGAAYCAQQYFYGKGRKSGSYQAFRPRRSDVSGWAAGLAGGLSPP